MQLLSGLSHQLSSQMYTTQNIGCSQISPPLFVFRSPRKTTLCFIWTLPSRSNKMIVNNYPPISESLANVSLNPISFHSFVGVALSLLCGEGSPKVKFSWSSSLHRFSTDFQSFHPNPLLERRVHHFQHLPSALSLMGLTGTAILQSSLFPWETTKRIIIDHDHI